VGAAQYRLTILSTLKQHWGYDVRYVNGKLIADYLRRPPVLAAHRLAAERACSSGLDADTAVRTTAPLVHGIKEKI